uniref:Putative Response regulator receiver modulated metal dependent phosphohydrolase [Include Response regulator receiver domain and HD domain] n=1 Tax=Magnetococcus massalia (strain MO-1) TaxID=451514 RepID=A0A1S7LJQ9_MAGMO|nr:putative Response regulator receiver modulated metal dependent phosphohydrolase [Include Response regulator receiver domain and HD domain] [Candidatus Magnetococcus massalia]
MEKRPTILIIDDTPDNIKLLVGLLKKSYNTLAATHGAKGIELASRTPQPDLILLDVMMPDLDGYAVCQALKSAPSTAEIPILFLTARASSDDEERGLDLGAVDYISKPISPPILLARLRTHLGLKQAQDSLKRHNDNLQAVVEARTQELASLQEITIQALGGLAETRDQETGHHIKRTQLYVKKLAEILQSTEQFHSLLTPQMIDLLYRCAPLHDIGKVGIPDHILLKQGELTVEEFEVIKRHTLFGRQALDQAAEELNTPSAFLQLARELTYSHHEWWDGSGYPEGLQQEEIPLSARIMAVADVYDALISQRVYKRPWSHEEALETLKQQRARQFDPRIIDAFLRHHEAFSTIASQFCDPSAPSL